MKVIKTKLNPRYNVEGLRKQASLNYEHDSVTSGNCPKGTSLKLDDTQTSTYYTCTYLLNCREMLHPAAACYTKREINT